MKLMTQILIIGIALLLGLGVVLSGWYVGRIINYKLSYENFVQETVGEMVKKECLK